MKYIDDGMSKQKYFTEEDRSKRKDERRLQMKGYARRPDVMIHRKKYRHDYYIANREKVKEYLRRPGVARRRKRYMRKYMLGWKNKNKEKTRATARETNIALKQEVYAHYGGGCRRCGFGDIRALSIDHINGGGNRHRKEIGRGNSFWRWLKKNNYPSGFQILCMNCQFIKRYENKELEAIK